MFLFDSLGWFGFWMSDWEWLIRGKILFVTARCMEFSCFLHTCSRMNQSKNKKKLKEYKKKSPWVLLRCRKCQVCALFTFGSESTLKSMCITILIYIKKCICITIYIYIYICACIHKKFHYFNNWMVSCNCYYIKMILIVILCKIMICHLKCCKICYVYN